jgi:ketosteroid isomerase-like protein
MSSKNVELVQTMLGAYLSGDQDGLRAIIAPAAEIYGAPGLINSGTYIGYDGFQEWIREWEEAWDEVTYDLQEMIEIGDSIVVVPAHIVGRGAGSGVETDSLFGWLFEFRDDRAVRFHAYVNPDEALEAARGLAGQNE